MTHERASADDRLEKECACVMRAEAAAALTGIKPISIDPEVARFSYVDITALTKKKLTDNTDGRKQEGKKLAVSRRHPSLVTSGGPEADKQFDLVEEISGGVHNS